MNNQLKDNSHLLNFSEWYKFVVEYQELYECIILSNEDYLGIDEFFDYYLMSPNNLYYCPNRDKTYPIGSKSRTASSYENLIEILEKYRNHYEKMFLYTINKDDVGNYTVRFAVFPEKDHLGTHS